MIDIFIEAALAECLLSSRQRYEMDMDVGDIAAIDFEGDSVAAQRLFQM